MSMDYLRFTLVSEGTTDENLVPILEWAIREQGIPVAQGYFARWHLLPKKPTTIVEKIIAGLELQKCDVLFVHRDADNSDPNPRRQEIQSAVDEISASGQLSIPSIPVVPIQETEAWLLLDEKAIRCAANNPNGKNNLELPHWRRIEQCPDAKSELRRVLRKATEYGPLRLKRFDTESARTRVVNYFSDFKVLRQLSGFRQLESDLVALRQNGWRLL